jgi:signal transduction histidine kinase
MSVLFITLSAQKYSAVWLTTDHGLPQNSVKDMVKDRYGYLWISTERGIIRYDGNTFSGFDCPGLSNLHFMNFSGSREKDSIVVRNDGYHDAVLIRKRNARRMIRYVEKTESYRDGNLYEYYEKSNLTEPTPARFYKISLRTGTYWFSRNRIIYETSGQASVKIPLAFDPACMQNVFAIDNTVFIRNPKQRNIIMIRDGKANYLKDRLFDDPDARIYWGKINRQVFLIRKDGIYTVSYVNQEIRTRKLLEYKNFWNYQFHSMYYDSEYRILYLGSLTRGMQVLRLMDFYVVKNNIASEPPGFTNLLPYTGSSVVCPEGMILDSSRVTRRIRFKGEPSRISMQYDANGEVICSRGHLLEIYHRSFGKPVFRKVCPFEIKNILRIGNTCFLSVLQNNGFCLLEFTGSVRSKVRRKFRVPHRVECIRQYDRYSYIAGLADGLYLIGLMDGSLKKIPHSPGIKNICRTRDGNLWAMSFADGFYLIRNGKLIRMPNDRNNNLETPHDLLEDRKGFVWIPTNNGLYRIRRQELLEYAAHPEKEVQYYRYSTKDGLNTNEFNGGGQPGALALANGQFAFPSIDGVVFFRPESVPVPLPSAGSLFVERVKSGDTVRNFKDTLLLKRDFHRAELYIDVPFYGSKENLVLEAQIDGMADQKWLPVEDNRMFVLERLPSGSHTVNVRVWIGGHRYTYKKLLFYIQPYFYETVWFRILSGIAGSTVLVIMARRLYHRFSTQKKTIRTVQDRLEQTEMMLEKEASYQESLFQAITHDIATPIKHLSNLSQMMLETENPNLQRKYFDSVYKSTRELYHLTMSLREYREAFNSEVFTSEPYRLREAIDRKIRLFADMAEYSGTQIINHTKPDLYISVKESIISIILQNLLDNAVKNTAGGTIAFIACREDHEVTITLKDTGKGMPEEQLNYYNRLYASDDEQEMVFKNFGLGLHLVIRLIKKIKGQIEFKKQTQGTLVIIKIIDICLKEF